MRVLYFEPAGHGRAAENPRAEVLDVPVPRLVIGLVARLRAATNSWRKTGSVEVSDPEHKALGEFRDKLHEICSRHAERTEVLIPEKKPNRGEAVGWVLAMSGHILRYGKVDD